MIEDETREDSTGQRGNQGRPAAPLPPREPLSEEAILSIIDGYQRAVIGEEPVVIGQKADSICLIGCGEAGSRLAGFFRLAPDFVPAHLPKFYPVRAAAFDAQESLRERLDDSLGWRDSQVQQTMTLIGDPVPILYGRDILFEGEEPNSHRFGFGGGGAGGFTLQGRAGALQNLVLKEENSSAIQDALDSRRLFAGQQAYVLTFSGLAGGTGSGTVPVIAEWMTGKLDYRAAFSVCITPPGTQNAHHRSNLLTSLHYLASCEAINGVILADNGRLENQGLRGYGGEVETFRPINQYLQDVLMPVFLSTQEAYRYDTQLDPNDVVNTVAGPQRRASFIAAGFSVCPRKNAAQRIAAMEEHRVHADPTTGIPDIDELLEKAFQCTTVDCLPNTARSILAVLSGPPDDLKKMATRGINTDAMERKLEGLICPREVGRPARFGMASFPDMKDIRLTVLLSDPEIPTIEEGIRGALDQPNWHPQEGQSLADALRELDEAVVLRRGITLIWGPEAVPDYAC